jgi:DNA invertase Pin-like site-specific DNA recombinase
MKTLRCAIYARVSKNDRIQNPENQLHELRQYAKRCGYEVVSEFIDHMTGSKGVSNRDEFQALFDAAARREFDVVLTWALDRFTREGIGDTFIYVKRLREFGIEYESYTEPEFRTAGPFGEIFMALAAWWAKQERQRIIDRTNAGLARARREGKTLGRPRRTLPLDRIVEATRAGRSLRDITAELQAEGHRCSVATVSRILSPHRVVAAC